MLAVSIGFISILLTLIIFILSGIRENMKELGDSIKEINKMVHKNASDIRILELEQKGLGRWTN